VGLLVAVSASAQGTGRSLDIQPGGRQNGMGAAGVALPQDATGATWWNPAALGFIERTNVQLTYAKLVPAWRTTSATTTGRTSSPSRGSAPTASRSPSCPTERARVATRRATSPATSARTSSHRPSTTARASCPIWRWALRSKWIRIQLAPDSQSGVGTTFGLDVAALYKIPAARLNFGANVQNLGPSVTFINEDQASPLSRNLKVGAAWTPYEDKQLALHLVADFNQSLVTNSFRTYNEGLELSYAQQFAGRIGWYADPEGQISGLCYGFGAGWGNLGLDFGGIPQAKDSGLDDVYKITLGYKF
jgi:hypothetical protein